MIQASMRSILNYLRYGSIFYGTAFSDVTGIESVRSMKVAGNRITLFFIFFMPNWSCKFSIVNTGAHWTQFTRASEFFSGAAWPEREVAEMFGINFLNKVDSRRLMLDYSFEGCPLLKEFPAVGYEEVVYCSTERWISYRFFHSNDTAELFYG